MAIKDLPPGSEVPNTLDVQHVPPYGQSVLGGKKYDYSHLLTPDAKSKGYQLHLYDGAPNFSSGLMVHITHPQFKSKDEAVDYYPDVLGSVEGMIGRSFAEPTQPSVLEVKWANLDRAHRGLKLGQSAYEALMAHAHHYHGTKNVSSGTHSTKAAAVWQNLSRLHGFEYKPSPNPMWNEAKKPSFDNKYLEHYTQFIKSDASDIETAKEMAGFEHQVRTIFEAARYLAAGQPLSIDKIREALWLHDGDLESAALAAYNIPPTSKNKSALNIILSKLELHKSEINFVHSKYVKPVHMDGDDAAQEIQRAFDAGIINEISLNGKHSKGTVIARDPKTGHTYLIKPGSGPMSPAMGVREDSSTQSEREAAFYKLSEAFGLSDYFVKCDLLKIDDQQAAAMVLLPFSFKNVGKLKLKNPYIISKIFIPLAQKGILHKFAAMDYILGNTDRHSQNIMYDESKNRLVLIDHGSAFAGPSFNPAEDQNSFIPFYLRASSNQKFSQISPKDRMHFMPSLDHTNNLSLEDWLNRLDETKMKLIMEQYNINPEPSLLRLQKLKLSQDPKWLAINKAWAGMP